MQIHHGSQTRLSRAASQSAPVHDLFIYCILPRGAYPIFAPAYVYGHQAWRSDLLDSPSAAPVRCPNHPLAVRRSGTLDCGAVRRQRQPSR
jgi:hypothetical protein